MKKSIYTLFFFLVWTLPVFSQISQGALPDSVIYLTPAEEAFMIDKETKSLFKVFSQETSVENIGTKQNLFIAFERKISNALSVSLLTRSPQRTSLTYPNGESIDRLFWQGGLELRYYYKMPGLIKKKQQANNLSSNYIGAKYERSWSSGKGEALFGDGDYYNIVYGIQKRFLNRGFVDFSVRLGNKQLYETVQRISGPQIETRNNFYLSVGIIAGLALGKNYKLSDDLVCPVFKCYSNRKFAFKINLLRTWSLGKRDNYSIADTWTASVSPNISYEIKLANSPLSFDQDLELGLDFSNTRSEKLDFGLRSYVLRYYAGFRFYHGMKNRISKGQSGNNLSGLYSFGRAKLEQVAFLRFEENPDTGLDQLVKYIYKEVEAQIGIGYQKEVLERLYFDLGIGAAKDIKLNLNRDLLGVQVISYIKVGLMF